ncbi:MAG TPA: PspC domain-containing protein [Candidatus Prevotella avicola]|jgi:phage shock protein PspC (stress-responsive transcriptional regulator)|uniref:PspC domain-containing protein n=1 Tax=Candidatus Prevotella avicola TaxID=2838738 RepID=A0A9D2JWG6_9BACT|nr:PspC domain-containing protein [Prevotella sp.]CDA95737.1 pspC domain protein [Prevotella sp. CAG:1320]HIZ68469.1 PspC domain-containing protein [Candidatus Prevotella avicola]
MDVKKRLTLSRDRKIAGVCGGIAEWLGVDPTAVRVAYTLLTLFTAFSGVVVYIVLWIVMPKEEGGVWQ